MNPAHDTTSADPASRTENAECRIRFAFTLIELLVVIAIIAILIAILLPAMSYAKTQAKKAATASLMASIGTGLEEYHSDFSAFPPSFPGPGNFNLTVPFDRGSLMLAEAMTGYLPGTSDGAGPPTYPNDPGFGFRTRNVIISGVPQGQIYGPFVPPSGATWKCVDTKNQYFAFIDSWGNEILYYRAIPSTVNGARRSVQYVFSADGSNAYFDVADNTNAKNGDGTAIADPSGSVQSPPKGPQTKFFGLLSAPANSLTGGEAVTGKNSYLLVSAGPDGTYFTSDDVVAGGK